MQRVFLDNYQFDNFIIDKEDFYHLKTVLRVKVGDELEVTSNGLLYLVRILCIYNDHLTFAIIKELNAKKKDYKVTLVQGIAKGDKNETIVKHQTELGIDGIIFSNMQFCVSIIDSKNKDKKIERYNKISVEAAKQAHRTSIPSVDLCDLKKIDYQRYDLCLLLDEEEAKKENPRYLNSIDVKDKQNILFLVGPEGGISPQEREYLVSNGFIPVSINDNILRTETASLSFMAVLDFMKRGN